MAQEEDIQEHWDNDCNCPFCGSDIGYDEEDPDEDEDDDDDQEYVYLFCKNKKCLVKPKIKDKSIAKGRLRFRRRRTPRRDKLERIAQSVSNVSTHFTTDRSGSHVRTQFPIDIVSLAKTLYR